MLMLLRSNILMCGLTSSGSDGSEVRVVKPLEKQREAITIAIPANRIDVISSGEATETSYRHKLAHNVSLVFSGIRDQDFPTH